MKDQESSLHPMDGFERRHQSRTHAAEMLSSLGLPSIESLIDETIPAQIRTSSFEQLPQPYTEARLRKRLRTLAEKNKCYKQYIGLGYAEAEVPAIIMRNVLENPAWYTAYTPYQAEISQGRLEMLFYFQTLITELTALPLAGASLLDEATAAAEAMSMCYRARDEMRQSADELWVVGEIYPQTLSVLRGRAAHLGLQLRQVSEAELRGKSLEKTASSCFAILLQYPDAEGAIRDHRSLFSEAERLGIRRIVCADILSLLLLQSPGEWGADVAVGSTQRFGVPLGYGGPHAAYFAAAHSYQRQLPGRIIGKSKDALGDEAYRMALQTREQHIRRERATSNICTSQVLLAVMATLYAIHHGYEGLRHIATRIHQLTASLAQGLRALSLPPLHPHFFDTLKLQLPPSKREKLQTLAEAAGYNLRYYEQTKAVGITLGESTEEADIEVLLELFAKVVDKPIEKPTLSCEPALPEALLRKTSCLQQPIFCNYQSEHELLRLIRRMEEKDFSLVHGMIPLGSCTMKLNASAEMQALSWERFSGLHPFVPKSQAIGYRELIEELEQWFCQITGFAAVSFQPNSGAQGEYAGLCVIKAYLNANNEPQRRIVLIPSSAHGTNPASARMAGMEVRVIPCDSEGNIDQGTLEATAKNYHEQLAALMLTYPSTHGVFEENIEDICQIVHKYGGQVYMDGANMNAQVCLTTPARIGADVCHLNLHKTFCIPHGGGGPGMGPIAVASHLRPYLPQHPLYYDPQQSGVAPVSAAPYGSASILIISYAYIALMGREGLRRASENAILHANYLKENLSSIGYSVLYSNKNGRVAHEFIIDCRPFQKIGIHVEDIAKRLMDYGFHAPTVAFPVPNTMMIEPTESESFSELNRFCEALQGILKEIQDIEKSKADPKDNLLKNAPHPIKMLISEAWPYTYSRTEAAYPLPHLREWKPWPTTARIDNATGDRHLQCSCPPLYAHAKESSSFS